MCATVPSMPVVLIVPLTDLSAAIVMVPTPEADVVTGGVSSAPVNVTFTSVAQAEPMLNASAAVATSARICRVLENTFMGHSWIRLRGGWVRCVRSCLAQRCYHRVDLQFKRHDNADSNNYA